MIINSKCTYLIKGEMKVFQDVHLNITLLLTVTITSPKDGEYMPCAASCGVSVQVWGSWTSDHYRQLDVPVALLTVLWNGWG